MDNDLDLVQAVGTPQSLNEQKLGIQRGSIFDSVAIAMLGDKISLYALEHNFHGTHHVDCSERL